MELKNTNIFFFLVCISITGYFLYLQFLYYIRNEDVASISYRYFNEKEKDEYPLFTICFRSIYPRTIFQNDLFNDTGVTPTSYERYLSGISVSENDTLIHDSLKYDDVVFDIHANIYINLLSSNTNSKQVFEMMSITSSFNDQFMVCYSKNTSFRRNVRYRMDYINLNTALFYKDFLRMELYFHKKGQLLRSFNKPPTGQIIPFHYKTGMRYEFEINEVEVLRGRRDSNIPCNDSLTNEDAYVLGLIMKKFKCAPEYYRRLASPFNMIEGFEKCTVSQYIDVSKMYRNIIDGFSKSNSLYMHPCQRMKILVTKTKNDLVNSDEGEIYIKYEQDTYREIVNTKASSFETLVGQVGGYVGT